MREIAVPDQPSPTDQSKAHVEAVYRNTHHEVDWEVYRVVKQSSPADKRKDHREVVYPDPLRGVNREVDRQVCQVDQDSTYAGFRERNHEVNHIVTEADFERRVNAEYRWP